jgi:hypothetical protein
MSKYLANVSFTSRDSEGNIGVDYHHEEITFTAKDDVEAVEILTELVNGAREHRPTDTIGINGFYRFMPVVVDEFATVSELEPLDQLVTSGIAYVRDWE